MALMDSFSRMNVEVPKTLHPFFTKSKDIKSHVEDSGLDNTPGQLNNENTGDHKRMQKHGTQDRLRPLEDLNNDRRKRLRSEGPEHEDISTHEGAEPQKVEDQANTTPLNHTVSMMVPAWPPPAVLVVEEAEQLVPEQDQSLQGQNVLKLNPNGTLGLPPKSRSFKEASPASRMKTISPKSGNKRTSRTSNIKSSSPSKLVIIRYNKGRSTAEHIEKIINDKDVSSYSSTLSIKPTDPIQQRVEIFAPKPVLLTKSLHPFFTKKAPRTEAETVVSSTPSILVPGEHSGHHTPVHIPAAVDTRTSPTRRISRPIVKTNWSKEAPWPWAGVSHVQDSAQYANLSSQISLPDISISSRKKSKGVVPNVSDSESVLWQFKSLPNSNKNSAHGLSIQAALADIGVNRIPQRTLLTWPKIRDKLLAHIPSDVPVVEGKQQQNYKTLHPAITNVMETTNNFLSKWDTNRCESQAWLQRYAPAEAAHVLQDGSEAIILRNWLKQLQVNNVDSGKRQKPVQRPNIEEKIKRKKKRKSGMDDFIMDEDDENAFGEADFTDIEDGPSSRRPSSMSSQVRRVRPDAKPRSLRLPNSVLLSGPSGCGKTAAVYAVAKELGFEVFEINPGSRRSGKDILDRIGDMMGNHLVQQVSSAVKERAKMKDGDAVASTSTTEVKDGRQVNMNSFFKSSGSTASIKSKTVKFEPKILESDMKNEATPPHQKQSLILLEEVDVRFAEDKQFWHTVIALVAISKRPVILTCNDDSDVPIQALPLHAILRFVPPTEKVACDYLTALAAREGHLLSQDSVRSLYTSTGLDLRASIATLNFWCQMGIGSVRGGLDWMVDRYPVGKDHDSNGFPFRAISLETYQSGQGWHSQDITPDNDAQFEYIDEQTSLSTLIQDMHLSLEDVASNPGNFLYAQEYEGLHLHDIELLSESLSALDVACQGSMRQGLKANLDSGHPEPTDKQKHDNLDGHAYIQSEPKTNHQCLDAEMTAAVLTNARRLVSATRHNIVNVANTNNDSLYLQQDFSIRSFALSTVHALSSLKSYGTQPQLTRANFSRALDVLAEDGGASENCLLSSFDRAFYIITLDLAPYIRAMARHDLGVERDQASLMVSNQKRVRLSRVSRSAAEGGRREEKRSEKKFGREVNLELIMETGGELWEEGGVEGVLPDLGTVKLPFYESGKTSALGSRYLGDMARSW